MNKLFCFAFIPLLVAGNLRADNIIFKRVPGMFDFKNGDHGADLGKVDGKEFEKLRPEVSKILKVLISSKRYSPKTSQWNDFPIDATYYSAIVSVKGKQYVINSSYLNYDYSKKTGGEVEDKQTYDKIISIFKFSPSKLK